jgi:hypothetical protein
MAESMKDDMSERRFPQAMLAADGATEPTRRIGGSQPSVVGRSTFPGRPMLSVEGVMDAARAFFQPAEPDDGDAARAQENRRMRR